MRSTIPDADPPFVYPILYQEIYDIYMAWAVCARVSPNNHYPDDTLVVLEKLIKLLYILLMMHKHSVTYITWHMITLTD